ncbi:hypothetical protein JCM8547_001755 [Rhodosporidiobolus lusitaniae]
MLVSRYSLPWTRSRAPQIKLDPWQLPVLDSRLLRDVLTPCISRELNGLEAEPVWNDELETLYRSFPPRRWQTLIEEDNADVQRLCELQEDLRRVYKSDAPLSSAQRTRYDEKYALCELLIKRSEERYRRVLALLFVRTIWQKKSRQDRANLSTPLSPASSPSVGSIGYTNPPSFLPGEENGNFGSDAPPLLSGNSSTGSQSMLAEAPPPYTSPAQHGERLLSAAC